MAKADFPEFKNFLMFSKCRVTPIIWTVCTNAKFEIQNHMSCCLHTLNLCVCGTFVSLIPSPKKAKQDKYAYDKNCLACGGLSIVC